MHRFARDPQIPPPKDARSVLGETGEGSWLERLLDQLPDLAADPTASGRAALQTQLEELKDRVAYVTDPESRWEANEFGELVDAESWKESR